MLVLDHNETFSEGQLATVVETLTSQGLTTVILPRYTLLAQRPTLGAILERKGIRVIAARQVDSEHLALAHTSEQMALLLDLGDTPNVTPGPLLTRAENGWLTPKGKLIPSWAIGDPLPPIPTDVVLPEQLLSWTDGYLVAMPPQPGEGDELLDKALNVATTSQQARERIEGEHALLMRNPTQTRIVSDASTIASTLLEADPWATGIGRGSAFASLLCYRLNITRVPPKGIEPFKFLVDPHTSDVDINVSARSRTVYLKLLEQNYHAQRLIVINKLGEISTHPSAVTIRSIHAATDKGLGITASDATALALPTVDLLSSHVVDQLWDVYQAVGGWPSMQDTEGLWGMYASGLTYGLPEIGTDLGQRLAKKLQPSSFDDLERLVALVRPGASNTSLTKATWRNAMIFQDDVRLALEEKGMDSLDAFVIANAIAKKSPLPEHVEIPPKARSLVDKVVKQGYLYPREHAQAYARQIDYLAWYRYEHPATYLDCTIASVADKELLIGQIAKLHNLNIVHPTLNESPVNSEVVDGNLVCGLTTVVGTETAQEIVASRTDVPFAKDPRDFQRRFGYEPPCEIGC